MSALATLGVTTCWTGISFDFVYGQAHTQRPILTFLAGYGIAWLGLLPLLRAEVFGRAPRIGWILGVALLARLILLPSELIQENDVYRYVLDGQVVLAGENPYRYAPEELALQTYHPLADDLQQPEARQVLERISYPGIPTVYPPLAQVAFASAAWWSGWDWRGQRQLFLLCDLATIFLLWKLLSVLGGPAQALVFYAWNPLVLKEIANSAHLDALVALAVLGAVSALICANRYGRQNRPSSGPESAWQALFVMAAAACLAGAALAKLYPLILIPCFLAWLKQREGWHAPGVFAGTLAVFLVVGYFPFWDVGLDVLFSGLRRYASEWRMNEGLFSLLALLPFDPRTTAAVLIGSFAVLRPLLSAPERAADWIQRMQEVLLLWFLLLPAAFPWYALPLAALAVLRPFTVISRTTWVLSGMASVYYLSFYVDYHELDRNWWHGARLLEYAVILGCSAGFLYRSRSHRADLRGVQNAAD